MESLARQIDKDEFILKPNYGFGGEKITIGKYVSNNVWKKKISNAFKKENKYVLQVYEEEKPLKNYPVFVNEIIKNINAYPSLGIFCINNNFAFHGRISQKRIVNVCKGAVLAPVVLR